MAAEMKRDPQVLAGMIDHTILKPEATRAEVARLCDEAIAHGFASVCVNGVHTVFVAELLKGSNVVSKEAAGEGRTLEGLGITAHTVQSEIPAYLWRFRKCGQFQRQEA